MAQTRTVVATPNASRYLQQLCKHWGHKFEATFDAERGTVDFGDSDVSLTAHARELDVLVNGREEELSALEHVIEEHLQRFAAREGELVYHWHRL